MYKQKLSSTDDYEIPYQEALNSALLIMTLYGITRAFKSTCSKSAECSEFKIIKCYTQPNLLIINEVMVSLVITLAEKIIFKVYKNVLTSR